MNFSHPVSTCPPVDLARTIAALANSGGGECRIEGEHGPGRELLGAALREIVPPPTIIDATGFTPPTREIGAEDRHRLSATGDGE